MAGLANRRWALRAWFRVRGGGGGFEKCDSVRAVGGRDPVSVRFRDLRGSRSTSLYQCKANGPRASRHTRRIALPRPSLGRRRAPTRPGSDGAFRRRGWQAGSDSGQLDEWPLPHTCGASSSRRARRSTSARRAWWRRRARRGSPLTLRLARARHQLAHATRVRSPPEREPRARTAQASHCLTPSSGGAARRHLVEELPRSVDD